MILSQVVNRINGNVDRFTTDLLYYIGGEHFESNELEITKKGIIKDNLGVLGFKFHFAFQDRDVIFMARNPHLRKAGMVHFAGLCSDASYILRSKDENVLSQEYLAVLLQSDHFWNYCESHKVGSVNFANNWTSIANYEFDLPPIERQREVAAKVWAAYEVKESYKNLLAQTDKLLHAQFEKMFGDETNTPHEKLEKLCNTFIDGDWIESKDQSTEGVRLIQTGNVGNGEYLDKLDKAHYITESTFDRLHCTEIFAGDILISRLPDPIGRACILPDGLGKAITAVDCTIIRLKEERILPKFFIAATNSTAYQDKVRSFITGTTRARISRGNMATIEIPVPSIEKQKEFVTVAEQAEQTKASLNKGIEAIEAVIRSLIAEGTTKA